MESVPAHQRPRAADPGHVDCGPARPEPGDDLTEGLRGGSRDAMSQLFRAHLDVIYNYCYRRSGSWAAAEDLAATVFLEVWRSRRRAVSVDGSTLPWIYGIATNVCRNHYRSQLRHASAIARLVDEPAAPSDHGEHVANQVDNQRRVVGAVDRLRQLPQADQDVFVLVCWEELSYEAAAEALGIPIGTVRSRLARVRRRLRLIDEPTSGSITPEGGEVSDV